MHGDVMQAMLTRALRFALDTVQQVADGDMDWEASGLPDELGDLTSEQAAELRAYASTFMGRPM